LTASGAWAEQIALYEKNVLAEETPSTRFFRFDLCAPYGWVRVEAA